MKIDGGAVTSPAPTYLPPPPPIKKKSKTRTKMALISYWPQSTSKLTSKSPSSPTPSVADFKVAFQVDLTPKFPSGFLFKSIEFEICRFQLNFQLKFEWVGGGGRVGGGWEGAKMFYINIINNSSIEIRRWTGKSTMKSAWRRRGGREFGVAARGRDGARHTD